MEHIARVTIEEMGILVEPSSFILCPDIEDIQWMRKLHPDLMCQIEDGHRCMIELDGQQHFQHVPHFHKTAAKSLYEGIRRDRTKNMYCLKNNIHLLRISYLEDNSIDHWIRKFFTEVRQSIAENQGLVFMVSNAKLYNDQRLVKRQVANKPSDESSDESNNETGKSDSDTEEDHQSSSSSDEEVESSSCDNEQEALDKRPISRKRAHSQL
jgi:hypothetical protein